MQTANLAILDGIVIFEKASPPRLSQDFVHLPKSGACPRTRITKSNQSGGSNV